MSSSKLQPGIYTMWSRKKSHLPIEGIPDPGVSDMSVYAVSTPDDKVTLEPMLSDDAKFKWIFTSVKPESNQVYISPKNAPEKFWNESRDSENPFTLSEKKAAFTIIPIKQEKSTTTCVIRPDGAPDVAWVGGADHPDLGKIVALIWAGGLKDANYPIWSLSYQGSA
ncbi:unnamed protein product [Rhizoctonia solani]|uniref:Uncharacterized protein n=1 Tax=Rhizoctonia solani TaxID=456999 RepID=A0A8H3C8Y7_9AGAM|nr:unnamed protein product [Rhizoctonia solani]